MPHYLASLLQYFLQNSPVDHQQFLREGGNIAAAILTQHQNILDTDAEFAGEIDAGLCADDSAYRHGLFIGGGCVGTFALIAAAKEMLNFGSVIQLSSLVTMINRRISYIVIKNVFGDAEVGVYT